MIAYNINIVSVPPSDSSMCKPEFARSLPPTMGVRDGTPLLLSCSVRGDPEPQVSWLKGGKVN